MKKTRIVEKETQKPFTDWEVIPEADIENIRNNLPALEKKYKKEFEIQHKTTKLFMHLIQDVEESKE